MDGMNLRLLQVEQLDKKFGSHYALSNISMNVAPGEVHALVGENGAGKSTFIKILTGVYPPEAGSIIWNGKRELISDPAYARGLGINVVHQDRQLIPFFTGYENLYLSAEYPRGLWGIQWKKMRERAERVQTELGLPVDLDKTAAEMSPSEQTMVEILRAMMLECRLLILDEPTAALTGHEAEMLFALIGKLTAQGVAILYVSHRMEEIFRLSDRITVFRNGQCVGTMLTAETSQEQVIHKMSEVSLSTSLEAAAKAKGELLLEVETLSTVDGSVVSASLNIAQGEVVGLFGLAGSGRTELLEAIYGLRGIANGEIRLCGQQVTRECSPSQSLDRGVVLIPEERKKDGLIMGLSIRENMTLPVVKRFSTGWRMQSRRELAEVERWMEALDVKAAGADQPVSQLSGGNQQKVVFAKALLTDPVLFLCDEPTQAVDVMTREEIHRLLKEQAAKGCGVLFVSSDLQEVLDISDRLYVLREGRIITEMSRQEATAEEVLRVCYGEGKGSEHNHG